jgi:hypothetical protein
LTSSIAPGTSAAKISGCGRQTRVASPSAGSRSSRKRAPSSSSAASGGEGADAQLRALQIGEDPDRAPGLGLDAADHRVARGDLVMGAVAHVQAEDIGAGLEQRADGGDIVRGRAERGDDLDVALTSHASVPLVARASLSRI